MAKGVIIKATRRPAKRHPSRVHPMGLPFLWLLLLLSPTPAAYLPPSTSRPLSALAPPTSHSRFFSREWQTSQTRIWVSSIGPHKPTQPLWSSMLSSNPSVWAQRVLHACSPALGPKPKTCTEPSLESAGRSDWVQALLTSYAEQPPQECSRSLLHSVQSSTALFPRD